MANHMYIWKCDKRFIGRLSSQHVLIRLLSQLAAFYTLCKQLLKGFNVTYKWQGSLIFLKKNGIVGQNWAGIGAMLAAIGLMPAHISDPQCHQLGEGAYRRGNSLDDSRLWSAAVEPDGRACAEWTTKSNCIVDQTGVQCYNTTLTTGDTPGLMASVNAMRQVLMGIICQSDDIWSHITNTFWTRMWNMISSPATPTVCQIFKVATWHYRCRHHLKYNCIWDNLHCCLLFCG